MIKSINFYGPKENEFKEHCILKSVKPDSMPKMNYVKYVIEYWNSREKLKNRSLLHYAILI